MSSIQWVGRTWVSCWHLVHILDALSLFLPPVSYGCPGHLPPSQVLVRIKENRGIGEHFWHLQQPKVCQTLFDSLRASQFLGPNWENILIRINLAKIIEHSVFFKSCSKNFTHINSLAESQKSHLPQVVQPEFKSRQSGSTAHTFNYCATLPPPKSDPAIDARTSSRGGFTHAGCPYISSSLQWGQQPLKD